MPRKIRQLKADLRRGGFREVPGRGKGDHSWWEYPGLPGVVVNLDGKDNDDAHPYQEKEVRAALQVARKGVERQ